MKSKYFTFAIIFTFSLLISISINAETEPNNDIANANEVALNSTQQGSLNLDFNGDRYDFYKIVVPIDGRLTLLPSNTTENQYKLLIHSIDKDNSAYSMFHWEGNSGNILAVNISPGIYFIEINNRQNSWEGNYSVQFKFDVLTHIDKEPNDTKENATNLVLNQENGGNLINRKNGDWDSHDFWKITIVEGGRLTIKDNTENTLDYQIFIRDEDGGHFHWEMRKKDNSGDRIACSLTPGTYFLDISRTSGGYQNYGCYTIFPEFIPAEHPGDTEPNDTKENASTLVLNQFNSGNLIFRKDSDWDSHDFWKITIVEGGRLTIKDNTENTLDYQIFIRDEDGGHFHWEMRKKDNSGDRIACSLTPGTYFLDISRTSGGYQNYGCYTIFPEFIPAKHPGDTEPNDTKENASTLVLNQFNSGNLIFRKDSKWDSHDFWKITITEEGRLTIKDSTENTLDYKILLCDDDGSQFRWNNRRKDNIGERISYNLSPGIYYLEFRKISGEYNNYGSYTIFPQFVPTKLDTDLEPNDKIENAQELILNYKNTGNLGSRKNGTWDYSDYWKFSLTKETQIIFRDSTESTLSYKILLQHDDGGTFAWENRQKDNIGDRIEKLLSPGDYILKIDNQHTGNSTYGSYSIFPQTKTKLGVPNIEKDREYIVYPNPVRGILNIESKIIGSSFIEVIDINGKYIKSKVMNTNIENINLETLSKGLYYVRITNEKYSITKKIIVK